ncbi:MAG: HAD family hydrolase [Spirochaetales bacterium]|nr:HAD family hydrolase [Spirochaetales bacterium]
MNLLNKLNKHYETLGRPEKPLVIFDVDSTLMNTEPRNRAILEESAKTIPPVADYLEHLDQVSLGWNFLAPLEEAGLNDRGLLNKIRHFWSKRFFTDEYVIKDKAYPGSMELLNALKEGGFRIVYLTGRHIDGMSTGTKASFRASGYPVEEESFFFKPSFDMDDAVFKEQACREIAALGTVIASFDNEPANCNLLARAFPEGLHFWLDTITSPEPEALDEGIIRLDGF